jgi:hypothetical protein
MNEAPHQYMEQHEVQLPDFLSSFILFPLEMRLIQPFNRLAFFLMGMRLLCSRQMQSCPSGEREGSKRNA